MESSKNPDKPPIIDLANVTLRSHSGSVVFSDLNLSLMQGRSVLIIGQGGSGKTSLVDLILGRRSVDSGSVEVFGTEMRPHRRRQVQKIRRRIGGVGGVFELMPVLTVAENIELPLIIKGERRAIRGEKLRRALSEFSLLKQASLYPSQLTRVENSMTQFARAAVASPSLMIIDEPLAGLDQKTYQRVIDYLFRVAASGYSMIILCSEPLAKVLPSTDIRELTDGKLV